MLYVVCVALLHFSTSSRKVIKYEICVPIFCINLSKKIFILRIIYEIWSKIHIGLPGKYTLFLSDFNCTWTSDRFSNDVQMSKLHDNPSSRSRVVPCGKTDRWESESRFSQFCELAPFVFDLTLFIVCHFQTCKFKTILKYIGGGGGEPQTPNMAQVSYSFRLHNLPN